MPGEAQGVELVILLRPEDEYDMYSKRRKVVRKSTTLSNLDYVFVKRNVKVDNCHCIRASLFRCCPMSVRLSQMVQREAVCD